MWGLRGRALVAFLASFVLGTPAASALITVTTTSDAGTGAGDCAGADQHCSLRQAFTAAGSGAFISVPAGTYRLTQGELSASNGITVTGAGARTTTIKQTGLQRVILLTGGTVTIQGVTITGGHSESGFGGGIAVDGATVTLRHVAVTGNEDDGFTMGGPTDGAGGGIATLGPSLTIIDSTISGNSARQGTGADAAGGGILSEASLTIVNSTIADNTAAGGTTEGLGGGIYTASPGGGTSLTLANTTVASNTASGSPAVGGNIDVAQSGGAVTTAIRNSIVANGTADSGSQNCASPLTSGGYNLDTTTQCGFAGTGDRQSVAKLGALGNNGGATDTLALLPGSPAINGGNPSGCVDFSANPITTDQRGIHRPQGTRCDIGAFEFRVPVLTGVPRISGTPQVGQKLTCLLPAVQSPDGPATSAVTWLRDGSPVASGRTYVVRGLDRSHRLSCRQRVLDAAGSASATSAAVLIH
jgi:hypothetical protein